MIRKSVIVFFLVFAIWNVLIGARWITRYRVEAPNQWIANEVRAQKYAYDKSTPRVVLAGSSLTFRLPILREDHANLAFAGSSAFTGLEIIKRSGKYPQWIAVETNTIISPAQTDLIRRTFNPVLYHVRKRIHSQRAENHPMSYALYPFLAAYVWFQSPGQPVPPPPPHRPLPEQNPAAENHGAPATAAQQAQEPWATGNVAQEYTAAFSRPPEIEALRTSLETLAKEERECRAKGCRMVFYTMPIAAALRDTAKNRAEVDFLHRFAKENEWMLLPDYPENDLGFSDGYHLDKRSAPLYAAYIDGEILKTTR